MTPILAVSGPSGVGKTRLLSRLVAALASRGLRVGILKHTGHDHDFDVPGKDTEVLRRAGAVAAAIEGPRGMAYFGPPAGGARALARFLPPVDLILAEGWKHDPLPKIEVHRRSVSPDFLCARDHRVFAVVTDTPPPRAVPAFDADDVEPLADLVRARCGFASPPAGLPRLRVRPRVRSLPAEGSERTIALGRRDDMAKTNERRSGTSGTSRGKSSSRTGKKTGARGGKATGSRGKTTASRSAAGRKGGTKTLRTRGPEFYSEIGKKGGQSRSKARKTTGRGGAKSKSGSGRSTGGTRRSASGKSARGGTRSRSSK